MNTRQAIIAAHWWALQLWAVPQRNAADESLNKQLTDFSRFIDEINPLSLPQINDFETALYVYLSDLTGTVIVDFDYGPDRVLKRAADDAGINLQGRMPVKTKMYIEPERIRVSVGYGPLQELLNSGEVGQEEEKEEGEA